MKKSLCVAVDDEPLALRVIENYCSRIPQLELICFNSPILAKEYILGHKVDILFLDINMPEMKGLDMAAAIDPSPFIIFTTAYPQYAVQSYDFNTVGYLLKPYHFTRFEHAVRKALYFLDEEKEEKLIAIKVDYRKLLLPVDKILYIEAMGNYLKIYTTEQCYLPQMTMKEAESLLDSEQFKRIHRSFIINVNAIDSYSRREVLVAGTRLPIGKVYVDVLASAGL